MQRIYVSERREEKREGRDRNDDEGQQRKIRKRYR